MLHLLSQLKFGQKEVIPMPIFSHYAFIHFFVAKSTSAQVEGVAVGGYADIGNAEL